MPPPDAIEMIVEVLFDHIPDRGPDWGESSFYHIKTVTGQRSGATWGPMPQDVIPAGGRFADIGDQKAISDFSSVNIFEV